METRKPGARIGPYELLSPIGAGGMGEVWKARDTRLDRTVAIKFSQAAFTDRFQHEARAIAALNHPNIATIHDVGENYLVMEFVDGDPIKPPNDTRKLLDIAVQIADGLAAAHSAGIVHRDLKPGNILLTKNGRIKILDFGLAKQTVHAGDATETFAAVTDPGTIVGTAAYMSPEQARGKPLDARSDQFSFGLVLYELATGKRAFQRASTPETLSAIIRDDADPLPPTLPAPLRWLIERCLAKDPESRYDSTGDLFRELKNIRERLTEAATSVAATSPAKSSRLIKTIPYLFALALAVVVFLKSQEPWRPDLSKLRFVPFATEEYPEYGAVWSPDGRSVAYCAIASGEYRLMVKNADGSAPAILARHPFRVGGFIDLNNVSWSPDGSRLYYHLREFPYTVARAGGASQAITIGAKPSIRRVKPAPDGSTFAIGESLRDGGKLLYRLSLASSPTANPDKVLMESERATSYTSWAPDASRLLVSEYLGTGFRLWLIHRDGTRRSLFDGEGATSMYHSWLPGSRYAALITSPSDQGIRVVDTVSGTITPILPALRPFGSVSVSPDGTRLAVTEGRPGTHLTEIPLDGGAARTFLASSLNHSELSWSPSGDEFVYVQGESIRVRNRAGTLERSVVSRHDFPGYAGSLQFEKPSFSPDGQRILYTLFGVQGRARGIWISPSGGGPPYLIEKAEGFAPTWAVDGAHIHFQPGQQAGVWKYRLGSDDTPIRITPVSCDPSPSPDGKWILCPSTATIASLDGKEETRKLSKEFMVTGTWSRDSAAVYLLNAAEKQELLQFDIATGRSRVLSTITPHLDVRGPHGGPTRMALSPDGKSVITTVRRDEGDIWLLEGFATPRSFWERWLRL